ncbi:CpsD/CapB family tyrosine-protein kinase [Bacillus sp. EAC]|uniref:CpsD/CapB family tyrosine-protein kinase n=1 Tax=Bacillus sp. EAC TaxID=1978338 RepID=UPI000B43B341|nr:CpsD/CapB family tyrosine-protein kinase [Bacillus sp. EAC]
MRIMNRKSSHSTNKVNLVTANNKGCKISEEYRSIRTNFLSSIKDQESKALIVTSPNYGEGKSTTAANFAISLAQLGKKVLLIDANLRNSTLHFSFKKSNYVGLSSVLLGRTILEESIIESEIIGLDLLTSGPDPFNPADLLGSHLMKTLIETATEKYDLVLIDSPPALEFTDTKIIANHCDGVILVIQWGKTKSNDVIHAQKILSDSTKLMGVILNDRK